MLQEGVLRLIRIRFQHPVISPLQVSEHRVFRLASQDNRFTEQQSPRNNHRQLVRRAARIGQVSDDESSHVRQRGNRAGEIFAIGLFKVEEKGQVIAFAKLIANRI